MGKSVRDGDIYIPAEVISETVNALIALATVMITGTIIVAVPLMVSM